MYSDISKEYVDVVLFNSPLYKTPYDDGETYLPPIGQGYIITALRQRGIESTLIDCVYERLGVSAIVDIINQGSFSNIGFNIFSVNMMLIKDILVGIHRPVNIFLGGKAVEYLWEEVITWNICYPITFIIGEGEKIFPDLILHECKEQPIFDNGLHKVYLVGKKSYYYPSDLNQISLDRLLFKDREILNLHGRYEASIVASRGCIYDCAFCGGATSSNPNVTARIRSKMSLAQEISEIVSISPHVRSIRVLDDLFLRNRQSIIDASVLFDSFPLLHWRCMAHVNTFIHNLDLIVNMKDSGCDEVFIGIESGSPRIREFIHKKGTVEDIVTVAQSLLAEGIHVKGYFMCGFPEETEEDLQETFSLAQNLHEISKKTKGNFRSTVFQFRPYHGTALYNQLYKNRNMINYRRQEYLTSSHQQYNFSAGNFSKVSDEKLMWYIHQIDLLNR